MLWGRITLVFYQRSNLKCKKEEVLESFKTAIKSTIKSISNKDNIEINFGGQDVSNENTNKVAWNNRVFTNNFDLTRAQADLESLRLRHSNKKI